MTKHQRWALFTIAAGPGSGIALSAADADAQTEALKNSHAFQHDLKEDPMDTSKHAPQAPAELENADSWITRKVEDVLAAHRRVRTRPAEVATEQGVVTLRGKVDTEAEKHLAGLLARGIEGVLNVENQMVVAHRPI